MFLHIGKDVVVPLSEIISIVNLSDNPSQLNNEFLKTAEEEGFVIQLSEEPNSLVISSKKVYLSPISVQTLSKRARQSPFRIEMDFKES